MFNARMKTGALGMGLVCAATMIALAQSKDAKKEAQPAAEQERQVKEAEVPKAPLDALKKLAEKNAITEFAEEIEHGNKFYEGSWKGPNGNVDALVTEAGDLVEIEEFVPADKVPAKIRAEAEKKAGKDAKIVYEKKTMILYEIHYQKAGKENEAIFTPDARIYHEEQGDGPDHEGEKKGE